MNLNIVRRVPRKWRNKIIQILIVWIAYQYLVFYRAQHKVAQPQAAPSPSPTVAEQVSTPSAELFTVTKVADGDTIHVQNTSGSATVRLLGIDSPESVDPRKPVECFAKEASTELMQLLNGKTIRMEGDPTQSDHDRYDRLLRYIYLEDGSFINKRMIERGFAYEYTYDMPYQFQAEFKAAEKEATENKRGLWADESCGR